MARISSPIVEIKDQYEVVVIGSGYGGGVSASRLARAGRQVCILERGKEIQPGDYPDTELEALEETQINGPREHIGSRVALYDYQVNDDISALVGCGLGGTSLINANVAIRLDPRLFDDPRWPQAFRDDVNTRLEAGYQRAEEMLKPTPYPENFPELPKLSALEKSARAMDADFYRLPINVTFKDGRNHVGVSQQACALCGDCVSGCNYGAKNTTLMNYLPDAKNHGAEIFTQVSVRHLERKNGRWIIHYQLLNTGAETFDAPTASLSADIVVLAAGTYGSNEILLRSKAAGLPLSNQVGHHFSGNGDVGGAAYNTDQVINSVGFGQRDDVEPVGPTITGVIDLRDTPDVNEGMVIEEGTIHSLLAPLLPHTFSLGARIDGVDTDSGIRDAIGEKARQFISFIRGPYHGAVKHSQLYLVMTHDDSGGQLYLQDGRIRARWPGVGKQPFVDRVNDKLEETTRALGGTFVDNPVWNNLPHHGLVTAHPLGGCRMAEDAGRGVVNHKGQVFAGESGTAVYEGLYVCDGSVMPRSLGANPLLTISAVAERCMALLVADRGWKIDYTLAPPPSQLTTDTGERLSVQFTETMSGHFSAKEKVDYQQGAQQGEEDGSSFRFILTIVGQDLEKMMADPAYVAQTVGTVTAPALSPTPLTVTNGTFELLATEPGDPAGVRRMKYTMKMTAEGDQRYYFEGFKWVKNDPGLDLWPDTTTLYITIHEGEAADTPILGRGILRLTANEFMRQLATIRVTNARSTLQRLANTARFGRFFAGTLFDVYGGILAPQSVFDAQALPRKKRPLRVGAPEVHPFFTSDNVELRLTRYQGGEKGPVMLVHGLGVSSRIFSTDMIDTNLLEFLYAHEYDVWLLDYRASILLPASNEQSNGDDIATKDYPAAVNKIREVTGAGSVQAVVHCYGATTFFMAMLAGLEGVRTAVASQIATNIVAPTMTKIKTGLHFPTFLDALGIDSLTAYVDTHADWQDRIFDQALKLYPTQLEERCSNPVCHRISFMYAPLYEHDQLNNLTHTNMHELFGIANITSFEHLALMIRKGQIVAADGQDVYMPHLERLAIPITFIHGAENECYLPQSTEITYNLLRQKNGDLYRRHVIPNYGHIDCIFGKDAVQDVYPLILAQLEATA